MTMITYIWLLQRFMIRCEAMCGRCELVVFPVSPNINMYRKNKLGPEGYLCGSSHQQGLLAYLALVQTLFISKP